MNDKQSEKMTTRAAAFDECVGELSEQAQKTIADLVAYIAKTENGILGKSAGEASAKELLFQLIAQGWLNPKEAAERKNWKYMAEAKQFGREVA